jgi:hypothetical protein
MNLHQATNSSIGYSPALLPQEMRQGLHIDVRAPVADAVTVAPWRDIPIDELSVRLLTGSREIAGMAELRTQINLAAAIKADPHFPEREKKETN